MPKLLVIPDIHLKPYMFDMASALLHNNVADSAIFIGDLVDDWDQTENLDLYNQTINRAIEFKSEFEDSLWCYGNHDVSYLLDEYCPGNSEKYYKEVKALLSTYVNTVEPQIIHKVDNVIFSHAGIEDHRYQVTIDGLPLFTLNNAYANPESPLWTRPAPWVNFMYKEGMCQVVGHSPMPDIEFENGVYFVDTFSTNPNGSNIGKQKFLVIDTKSLDVEYVKPLDNN